MDFDPYRDQYRPPEPEPEPQRARRSVYNEGRRRIVAVNRWVLAASFVLTGLFAGIASQAFHGKSRNAAAATPPPAAGPDLAPSDQPPAADDPGLQPPDQAPQPTQQDPGVASGGS